MIAVVVLQFLKNFIDMISVVVNVDSRKENLENKEMFRGVTCSDFWVDGLINKRLLFKDFDFELICFLDLHEQVDLATIEEMRELCDTLIIRKHNKKFEDQTECNFFNDLNYLAALQCARGKYIFHFDGDVASFTSSKEPIQEMIDKLEEFDFISYPSHWSPNPVDDSSFQGIYWISTRFFCCKRSTLDFTELMKCQLDYDYWKEKYPRARLCHWLEHLLHNGASNRVFYPPLQFDRFILYVWENYHKYTLQRLNNQTFEEVKEWVSTKHFHYPNNLSI